MNESIELIKLPEQNTPQKTREIILKSFMTDEDMNKNITKHTKSVIDMKIKGSFLKDDILVWWRQNKPSEMEVHFYNIKYPSSSADTLNINTPISAWSFIFSAINELIDSNAFINIIFPKNIKQKDLYVSIINKAVKKYSLNYNIDVKSDYLVISKPVLESKRPASFRELIFV